jgi:phage shock protein B
MSDALGIIAVTIVAPIWIVSHYATKWRSSKGLSNNEAQMLESLWKDAQAMENRIQTLEAILDANVQGWRNKT